ncbi:MAG TPA: GNAT family N-acetyltransferase, partial [Hyphomicrobiaceae bacterium]|nr:GNAT family N-acetyltransferase [Hyphomicrobiaceae bacterium]
MSNLALPLVDANPMSRPASPPAALASAGASDIVVEAIRTRAGFEALEADWSDLFARAGSSTHVFQSFNWCWHWCNHFLASNDVAARGPRLAILAIRRAGRVVSIWPLAEERSRGLTRLVWLGDPVSQYGDALIDTTAISPAELATALADHARRIGCHLLHLRKTRADAAVAPVLAELGSTIVAREEAPYLDLASAPDFATYETRYSGHARRNRRRLLRRLNEHGTAHFEYHSAGATARDLATVGISMKRAQLKSKAEVSRAVHDERFYNFFADVADGRSRPAGVVVSALRSGGEIGAVQIGVAMKGRMAMHVIVTGSKFERFGAGLLHLESTIR